MKYKRHNYDFIFIFGIFASSILGLAVFLLSSINQNFLDSALAINKSTIDDARQNTNNDTNSINKNSIPTAKSVFDTGTMSLPTSVSALSDNKTMSLKNAHYIPSNLVIPSGTAIAFVHGDPNHIHSEIVKNTGTGNIEIGRASCRETVCLYV